MIRTRPLVFVAISRIRIRPEMADRLEWAFRNQRRQVDSFDGFLGIELLGGESKKDHFTRIFGFKDKEPFMRYMKSDAHMISHSSTDPLISQAIISNSLVFFTEATN